MRFKAWLRREIQEKTRRRFIKEEGDLSYRAPPHAAAKLDVLFTFSLNTWKFIRLHELNFRLQLLKVLANMFVSFFIALSFFLQNRTMLISCC